MGKDNGADRARAYRLRRMNEDDMKPADRVWLEKYEQEIARKSKAEEEIIHVEKRSLSDAVGEAALVPDASPDLAKEEGRRLDTLIQLATAGMERALVAHETMSGMLLDRVSDLMESQAQLMDSMSEHYTGRVRAEALVERLEQMAEGGGADDPMAALARSFLQGMTDERAERDTKRSKRRDRRKARKGPRGPKEKGPSVAERVAQAMAQGKKS